jgi:alginate O-acetyltransferase complex protein AlgI
MLFNSLTFLLFFGMVLALHHLPLPWAWKKKQLLVASYFFYAAWNPPFVILLWISTLVDWFAGRRLAVATDPVMRRLIMMLSLAVNLGLLGYFKYGDFLLGGFVGFLHTVGIVFRPVMPDIVLPVGISFYTFQSMSYTIDIYRGRLQPWSSFSDFALYVTFFPQLVAGPIVRAETFLPQCSRPRRATADQLGWGFTLLVIGLSQKVILADALLAPVVDKVYAAPAQAGWVDAWLANLAFSGQIFCDFAGYSTCAIGAALCLGFILPENFNAPLAAEGFGDFWRRWHISLSTWLRDYLYIPLGGNRKGRFRTYLNLMATMLLGGLWHGASWLFVFWGGLHGGFLAVERFLRERFLRERFGRERFVRQRGRNPPNQVRCALAGHAVWLVTLGLLCLTWVFFRSRDFSAAATLLGAMFAVRDGALLSGQEIRQALAVMIPLLIFQRAMRETRFQAALVRWPWPLRSLALAVLLIALCLSPGDDRAFIYFQF